MIEDWSGLHQMDAALRDRADSSPIARAQLEERVRSDSPGSTPLSVLLFEIILASAYAPDLFAELVITDGWAHVVRGAGPIDPETFDLSSMYSASAQTLISRTD